MGHVLKLEAVLFDLDGTLVDSVPDVRWSLNQALAAEGRDAVSIDKVKDYVGQGARQLAERALVDTGGMRDDAQHQRLLDGFLTTYRNNPVQFTTVFPGVFEALARLQARGTKLAICTNKPDITTWPVLRSLGFDKIFPVVLCGDKAHGMNLKLPLKCLVLILPTASWSATVRTIFWRLTMQASRRFL